MTSIFEPTREAALSRLSAFLPRAGRAYADDRNYDHGPSRRDNVSVLSPYIRHRLITEREVCAAVLAAHSLEASEKFIQEVLWRTYWKGWLEMRPGIWRRYQDDLAQQLDAMERNGGLRKDVLAAMEGRTGIDGFDDWAQELTETGYLHNHARMWFASIWIFTLRLPWELGADFFYRHLLDGDAASNTLSWRWVAGLQTRGKTYAASRDNIHKYTGGRFQPDKLAREARALDEPQVEAARPLVPMLQRMAEGAAVLLTDDDYGIETLPVDLTRVSAVAVADLTDDRTALPVSERVRSFADGAARDTVSRAGHAAPNANVVAEPMRRINVADILSWLERADLGKLIIPEVPVGPSSEPIRGLIEGLEARGIAVLRVRRAWDANAWPHATKGFFPFREQIPALLRMEGVI
jgi:deoxyribodipyrimidine photo-lyase